MLWSSGIVIDGCFLENVIPETARGMFKEQRVFVRSIAEETPNNVFYLDKYVQIRGEALSPFSGDNWKTIEKRFTAKQFGKLPSFCNFELTQPAKSADKIRVTLVLSESAYGVKGLQSIINFKDFTYSSDGPKYGVKLNIDKARKVVRNTSQSVTIKINFVPKPVPSRARAKEK